MDTYTSDFSRFMYLTLFRFDLGVVRAIVNNPGCLDF
jgi:hypothetical protein